MAGYLGTKAVFLSTTAASVTGSVTIGGDLTVDTNTLYVDSTNNNVGIGTSSPSYPLHTVLGAGESNGVGFLNAAGQGINFYTDSTASNADVFFDQGASGAALVFRQNATERMRIDASGNLLVGKTTSALATAGTAIRGDNAGLINSARAGTILELNRLTSDGSIIDFYKDGTTVGSIGNASANSIYIQGNGTPSANLAFGGSSLIYPTVDNVADLGFSGGRFDDIYATNGTIQTSDEREKQDIRDITEAEARVAQACKGLLKAYRWKDAVAEKGDDARIHFGIIAQDLQAAFAAEGLDAGDYAMFIHSTWWESTEVIPAVEAQEAVYEAQTDEDGNEVQVLVSEAVEAQPERTVTHTHETQEEAPQGAVERDRMGVRYPELLAFIIGAM